MIIYAASIGVFNYRRRPVYPRSAGVYLWAVNHAGRCANGDWLGLFIMLPECRSIDVDGGVVT